VFDRLQRISGSELCTWLAVAAAVAGAVIVVLAPGVNANRVAVVAVPFAVAAALLAANGLAWQRIGLIGAALYGVAALAIFYGIILALSVPVRLTVEGLCPRSAKTCPVGYDYPITNGENFAVYAALVAGAFAMLFVFFAVELRYRRRRRPPQLPQPPPP
jgi:hypothetical protein